MNPFGEPRDWEPLERFYDDIVSKAFPNDPLAKYHAGITFHKDGRVTISYKGEVKEI